MRGEFLNETLFLGLDHPRSVVARQVADDNAIKPHSALGCLTSVAYAADLTSMGDRLLETDKYPSWSRAVRQPIAPFAQHGVCKDCRKLPNLYRVARTSSFVR